MGINGIPTRAYTTTPVPIHTASNIPLGSHSFTIIPNCPVNLLGRDLFAKLQINLTTVGQGIEITSPHFPVLSQNYIPLDLQAVNPHIWASGPLDTGLISCTPYRATLKADSEPIYQRQYPLSREKVEGLRPMVRQYLEEGVLRPVISPYCTPVNPVVKSDGSTRFVQDLRAVNQLIVPIAPIVPDVNSLLSAIPADAACFSVFDLKNAFFSIPVDPQTQLLFAFNFDGRQLTWCRLPQGFIDSPVVYNIVLQTTLRSWCPPQGSVLLQYADDLLLCSSNGETGRMDGVSLLNWLAECGHKVSKDKVQWCSEQVEYLGFVLEKGQRKVSPRRIQSVLGLVRPNTQKEMLSFLGMINYCRQWISDCSYYDSILRQSTLTDKPKEVQWSNEMLHAYESLKKLLVTGPALGLPNYVLPFHLFARDNCKTMAGVLTQEHGGRLRPVAFFSKVMPVSVQGMPACLRALAACAMVAEMATTFTLGHPTILHTTHNVLMILKGLHTQHMSAQRLSGYEVLLIGNPSLEIRYFNSNSGPAPIINAMLGLKGPEDELPEEHDCLASIEAETSPRADMSPIPIADADQVFVDGSCSRPNDHTFHAGYAVVRLPNDILEAKPIPFQSAQAAELIALTRACQMYKDKPVTIYTDSKYAYGVVHDHGVIWARRGFTGADGKGISHSQLISDLLNAILLPSDIAIIHCRAHTRGSDAISKGNALADKTAKEAALLPVIQLQMIALIPPTIEDQHLFVELQTVASTKELDDWLYPVLQKNPKTGLICKEGKPCIPQTSAPLFIAHYHGVGHHSKKTTYTLLNKDFYITEAKQLVEQYVNRCITCLRNNPNNPLRTPHQHLKYPTTPFTHLQIDFTHIPNRGGKQEYALVLVDMFSRWPEAFPTKAEDARTVARILTKEIIPRWGCPLQINSDKGTAFTAKITKELVKALQMDWKFHIPYHPQSSGIVERMNRTIKDKLRKATGGTFHKWKEILPIVLAEIRMTPQKILGYSPFEILMGRPFPTPWAKKPLIVEKGDLEQIREGYVRQLIEKLDEVENQVLRVNPSLPQEPTHPFSVGDKVVIKTQTRNKNPGDFTYGPEAEVVAVTRTAVLTTEGPTWIHASRVKRIPDTLPRGAARDSDEVLTGADSPDLQRSPDQVLTGADSPDLQQGENDKEQGVGEFWTMVLQSLPCDIDHLDNLSSS